MILKTSDQKVRSKISDLGIIRLEFEDIIVIIEISFFEFALLQNFL